jgi:GDP-D-mannose dehydratase
VQTTKTSVHGAINMLDLARRLKARILQDSTSEMYGDPEVRPPTESYWGRVNCIGPRSCYDEGKRCAELGSKGVARRRRPRDDRLHSQRAGELTRPYWKQYTDPSREPTTISPKGPMAGDELMGPSVANDQRRVPSGEIA